MGSVAQGILAAGEFDGDQPPEHLFVLGGVGVQLSRYGLIDVLVSPVLEDAALLQITRHQFTIYSIDKVDTGSLGVRVGIQGGEAVASFYIQSDQCLAACVDAVLEIDVL